MSASLTDSINKVNLILSGTEELHLIPLAKKAKLLAENNPHDTTLVSVARVLNSLRSKQAFITRNEFEKIYNQFYTTRTNAELFTEELGLVKKAEPKTVTASVQSTPKSLMPVIDYKYQTLLASMFDKDFKASPFSPDQEKLAKEKVVSLLEIVDVKPKKVAVETGTDKYLVVTASFDTAKGVVDLYFPIEFVNNKIVNTNAFISNAGLLNLSNLSVKNAIKEQTGKSCKYSAASVLQGIVNSSLKELSNSDLALARVKLAELKEPVKEDKFSIAGYVQSGTYDQKITENPFTDKILSVEGQAEFKYGKNVGLGKQAIAIKLKNLQANVKAMKVSKVAENGFSLAVTLANDVSFIAPIKIVGDKAVPSSHIICNGELKELSNKTLSILSLANKKDYVAYGTSTGLYELGMGDLISMIKTCAASGEYAKAEDLFNVVKARGTGADYITAFDALRSGLRKDASTVKTVTCSNIISSNNTIHKVCGHTNLPLHKVYQDESGQCVPLYHRNLKQPSKI